ncbi:MAG: TauD/TfdA family dioxygenase [Gammaproteobacteria bacterium]|nr:TauD/TfdA family dioxygenase [Gammaproteobacteria bacterium]
MVSPFNLGDNLAYQSWREEKLSSRANSVKELLVCFAQLKPSEAEIECLKICLQQNNAVLYQLPDGVVGDKAFVRQLGLSLGLERLDGNLCADNDAITALQVRKPGAVQGEYIPYSNKGLNWHTDGYYNPVSRQIRAIVMHCVQPAAEGGENFLMDHELLYLQLRDLNPAYIEALMRPDAMTIPENVQKGVCLRAEQSGPVFSILASGHLHMRYSARLRHVIWAHDALTQAAEAALRRLMSEQNDALLRFRLQAGQGIICNNVLHGRSSFQNSEQQQRLLYRARYYDRAIEMSAV